MCEPVTLPFKNTTLPLTPLPTTDEIRACSNLLRDRFGGVKLVAISSEIIVKFGIAVQAYEGQVLVYLERYAPGVFSPRLYAMYYDSNDLFLVMQRVPGVRLDSIWPSLTEPEKDSIVAKLRQMFDSMRQAECPSPSFYGGLDGGSLRHYMFYSQKAESGYLGPFYSEADFVSSLTGKFRALTEFNGRPDFKVRFYETYLGRVLQNHRPTLTHGDVQQKNIIVAEDISCGKDKERSFNVTLVDWENAGWYPKFWEFFCASLPFKFVYWEDDWCWRTQEFLQVWPAENAMMHSLENDMGC